MWRNWTIAAMIALAAVQGASAHGHLKSASPAPESTISSAPTEVDLTFSEKLNLRFSGIKITGPGDTAVTTREAKLRDDDMTLIVPLADTLPAGTYTVEWHVLSADGHKTKGKYGFTVKP